ncbi:MAG: TIR domain-containing protein [Endomicrobiaceae bacterium]|nr:TIR domain-containing protein [Endomicrobiaceae bacterium]
MTDNTNVSCGHKLFISYSHLEEDFINKFITHLAPLKNNNIIHDWYDRKIMPGENWREVINNNLNDADIICLGISSNFLNSLSCKEELKDAMKLRKDKNILIIPIILKSCYWQLNEDISKILLLPEDGNPIEDVNNDFVWTKIVQSIHNVILEDSKVKKIKNSDDFKIFLNDSDILSNGHFDKNKVLLEDIFVYPELKSYDLNSKHSKTVLSENLLDYLYEKQKIIIAGENQSGKTTLCKKIYQDLRKRNFLPIYITYSDYQYDVSTENKIEIAFKKQYIDVEFKNINKKRIIPIIDDFHFVTKFNRKEAIVNEISSYEYQILIVDKIFGLNFKDENLLNKYIQFEIKELLASKRNTLIEKWISLTDDKSKMNVKYQKLDENTELIDTTLGKVFRSGIIPAYPFFILSILSNHEAMSKPLDQEITSQGHCYQALIYIALRKQNVKNEDVDTYINFLSEVAYFCFVNKKSTISIEDFDSFKGFYVKKYNLPIALSKIEKNLEHCNIFSKNSLNCYHFNYPYLYYYFVAKYISEHIGQNSKHIENIMANLHKDENSYIAIFLLHHAKNSLLLEEIELHLLCLFDKYLPANLSKEELKFFDKQIDNISKSLLPEKINSESERKKELLNKDEKEIKEEDFKEQCEDDREDNEFARELRRSIKTVEVIGQIIKNRSGSLEKTKLENLFESGMNVLLKILTSFFVIIREDKTQDDLIDFLKNRLELVSKHKNYKLNDEELEKMAKKIFWGLNFSLIYGIINKIVKSLGSDKLKLIIKDVCAKIDTPASFLIHQGVLMWYTKTIDIENIEKKVKDDSLPETATKILREMVANHCCMHEIDFHDRKKIESVLNMKPNILLKINQDSKNNK